MFSPSWRIQAARMRSTPIDSSGTQPAGLRPGCSTIVAVELLKLLSVACTITVCAAAPVMTWAIGLVPVFVSTWPSPFMSHSNATMWVPGAVVVPPASIVAGAPACGWPPGSASTTTGFGAGPEGGGGGGGGGGFGSGNATPDFIRTRTPLLALLQRRSPGLAAPGSGLAASGITSHGPK